VSKSDASCACGGVLDLQSVVRGEILVK
jgi:hypothetical protein